MTFIEILICAISSVAVIVASIAIIITRNLRAKKNQALPEVRPPPTSTGEAIDQITTLLGSPRLPNPPSEEEVDQAIAQGVAQAEAIARGAAQTDDRSSAMRRNFEATYGTRAGNLNGDTFPNMYRSLLNAYTNLGTSMASQGSILTFSARLVQVNPDTRIHTYETTRTNGVTRATIGVRSNSMLSDDTIREEVLNHLRSNGLLTDTDQVQVNITRVVPTEVQPRTTRGRRTDQPKPKSEPKPKPPSRFDRLNKKKEEES